MRPNSELDHEVLIQRLINALPCSECGSTYRWQDVFVIEEEAHSWTLVAFCPECGVECLVKAFVEDKHELPADQPPDLVEVEAWGSFLASFDGDLRDLLHT